MMLFSYREKAGTKMKLHLSHTKFEMSVWQPKRDSWLFKCGVLRKGDWATEI